MIAALLLLPVWAGAIVALTRSVRLGRRLLPATAAANCALALAALGRAPAEVWGGWLALDAPGGLFLGLTSVLFLAASIYVLGYLRAPHAESADETADHRLAEPLFIACLLWFLATMNLVCLCRHFGLLWVAIEATTLASAPLIYYHRHPRSVEATWKYLLICSVGIALALLGNICLGVAASGGRPEGTVSLFLPDLLAGAMALTPVWLKAAFILLVVGYGTKMGLAPLHTWLPDAHSEAPAAVSGLLSGALLNCAFLGILRVLAVCAAAGQAAFAREILLAGGIFSLLVAAVFILGQNDYKRLLAYSSVEHMGLLALGTGLGGTGVFAALFHAVNHSLIKTAFFFIAGRILLLCGTKSVTGVRGLLQRSPLTGGLWLAGFFAAAGAPPFGTFLSEFGLLQAALTGGRYLPAALLLGALTVVFFGLAGAILPMAWGRAGDSRPVAPARLLTWPPLCLLLLAALLGVWLPEPLRALLAAAAATVGGWAP